MSLAELKKIVGDKKLILGVDRTIKALRKGNLKKIFISANCAERTKETIETNSKLFKVDVSQLKISNEEFGVVVKKPFAVSVASLQK